jgi:hypothetical protein
LILRLLVRLFGELGADTQNRITRLNVEQLEALGEALLDFSVKEDVSGWQSDSMDTKIGVIITWEAKLLW